MQNLLLAVDRLSTWIGKVFAWTIVGLTLLISWEVFSRYVMNKPHAWMLDAQIMLYGTLFMTAGAYTLCGCWPVPPALPCCPPRGRRNGPSRPPWNCGKTPAAAAARTGSRT